MYFLTFYPFLWFFIAIVCLIPVYAVLCTNDKQGNYNITNNIQNLHTKVFDCVEVQGTSTEKHPNDSPVQAPAVFILSSGVGKCRPLIGLNSDPVTIYLVHEKVDHYL